jgi:hypothetical protein
MPNAIKYNVSAETLALKKGNFWIGTGDVGKGPTSSTGYYNGITPPSGGYTIYLNKETGGPSIYTVNTEAQMVSLTNTIGAQSFTTSGQCLNWFATQTDKMIFNRDYEPIVTNGLVLNLDAGFTPSYPTTGTTWYDVSSGGNNGTLTNGPTFNSANGGSIVFDGTNDYVRIQGNTSINISGDYTIEVWVNADSTSSPTKVITSKWSSDPKTMYLGFFPSGFLSHYRTTENNTHYSASYSITSSDFVNKWNQVVGITSGSTIQIWNNGVLKNSASWPGVSSVPNSPLIISGIGSEQYLLGKVSSTKVYNRALSAEEVLQNYNAQKSRFGL